MLPSPVDGCSHESTLWLIFNVGYHVGYSHMDVGRLLNTKPQCVRNSLPLQFSPPN